MKVLAIITVRNEKHYIERCISHLISQGINVYLIDNDSQDNTIKLAQKFLGKGLVAIDNIPYAGSFELYKILVKEEEIARNYDADWFMHYDADEIRYSPFNNTLLEAIEQVDQKGYNAINFDEFVFVPTSRFQNYAGKNYVKKMQSYYYFSPRKLRRLNLWKKNFNVDLKNSGGHRVNFPGIEIFPQNFILAHYIGLNFKHLKNKYNSRIFSSEEVNNGWHRNRINVKIILPNKYNLKRIDKNGWNTSDPRKEHLIFEKKIKPYA